MYKNEKIPAPHESVGNVKFVSYTYSRGEQFYVSAEKRTFVIQSSGAKKRFWVVVAQNLETNEHRNVAFFAKQQEANACARLLNA